MDPIYPLRFHPIFRRYLWGGRRLATVLGKPLGDGNDYAESWEVVDHGDDQSVVRYGPLAGKALHELVQRDGPRLFGPSRSFEHFPLLFKFLDAHQNLSVQVHPDDNQAGRLAPPDLGKTEAWVMLDVDPGSKVYTGLKRGFDRDALAREVARGTAELCLHRFTPQVGDCLFIPAGTVHALGAGLLVAEIQQSSDTTYRLSDWNRVGHDGRPRMLHVDQSLETIDYSRGPVSPQSPIPTDRPHVERLVACDKFVLDRWQLNKAQPLSGGDSGFHIIAVLSGEITIDGDPSDCALNAGQTALLPHAVCASSWLRPLKDAVLLDVYLP